MAEQLDSLLKKIQNEAITEAEQKAGELVSNAKTQAEQIVADAQKKAEQIIADAEKQSEQFTENSKKALGFAARDLLIYLREAITRQFDLLFKKAAPEIVSVEVIQEIMIKLATQSRQQTRDAEDLRVYVGEDDYHKLIDFFLHRFHEAVKQGAELHPMPNIKAGFRICLAKKDLQYDFSDDALVELLSQLINPVLAEMLEQEVQKMDQEKAEQK
jgi:vacuolar-type H+-ATPase subunit E/Vma4